MKTNLKTLIVMAVLLFATCILNLNTVQATGITDPKEILDLIPNTIKLDMLESEVFVNEAYDINVCSKNIDVLNKQITKIFVDNEVDLDSLGLRYENIDIYQFYGDIHKITISLVQKGSLSNKTTKSVTIEYKNTADYNLADEAYVKTLVNNMPDFVLNTMNDNMATSAKEFQTSLEKCINDNDVKVISNYATLAGLGEPGYSEDVGFVAFYKNDVLYATKEITSVCYNVITIPEETQDTDEAYISYALPEIKKIFNGFTVGDIKKLTGKVNESYNITNDGTFYTVSLDNGTETATVILKKDNITKVVDHVAIDKDAGVELKVTNIEKNNDVYTEMINKAKDKGYENVFNAYELTIASGELNPSEKLEITFSLGEENNGKQAIILHKKADGSYEEFIETVKNGKVTIEVSELSPFMIALKNSEPVNEGGNKELDDEPKTGTTTYMVLASAVATISLAGLAVIKSKKQ